jgi:hypothetical protein
MGETNRRQEFFRGMFLGTLLYTVVIGFFNDYTNILSTRSYSITFTLAILLQILTCLTFKVKDFVVQKSKLFEGQKGKFVLVFGVWAVMFFSKFVFLWAIGLVFDESVQIDGFFNIFYVVLAMTLAQKALYFIDKKLEK